MRTNIDINDQLIEEAFKYTEVKTKKELVNTALRKYINIHKEMREGICKYTQNC